MTGREIPTVHLLLHVRFRAAHAALITRGLLGPADTNLAHSSNLIVVSGPPYAIRRLNFVSYRIQDLKADVSKHRKLEGHP